MPKRTRKSKKRTYTPISYPKPGARTYSPISTGWGGPAVPSRSGTYIPSKLAPREAPVPPGGFPPTDTLTTSENDLQSQAEAQARAILNPLLAQIAARQAREEAQARSGAEAQKTQTAKVYSDFAPKLKEAYDYSIGQASTIENAVANRLAGVGQTDTAALRQKLTAMGAPDVESQVAQATKDFQGSNAADFARGMSDVGRLVSNSASDQADFAKQPGIAARQIDQDLQKALQELSSQYSDQTGELQANLPGQVQDIYNTLYSRRQGEQATTRESAQQARANAQQDLENKRYETETAYKKQQDAQEMRYRYDQMRQDALDKARAAKLAARQLMDKQSFARWEKNYDRQTSTQLKQMDQQYKAWERSQNVAAGLTPTGANPPSTTPKNPQGASSGNRFYYDPNTQSWVENPNYRPRASDSTTGKGKVSSAQQRQIVNTLLSQVYNSETGRIRDRYKSDKAIAHDIYAYLNANGVTDPATRQQITYGVFKFIEGKQGPVGTQVTPNWAKPKNQRKRKGSR